MKLMANMNICDRCIHNEVCGLKGNNEKIAFCSEMMPKIKHCKDCKWWKDSDGVYRRGVGAESKCPINNVSVNHGLGYCYMFVSKESEDKHE